MVVSALWTRGDRSSQPDVWDVCHLVAHQAPGRWQRRQAYPAIRSKPSGLTSIASTSWCWTPSRTRSGWLSRSLRADGVPRAGSGPLVVRQSRVGRDRDLRRPACGWSDRDVVPGLWGVDHGRSARTTGRRREPALPFPGSRCAGVGRHRLHLKDDESLPVGRAHPTMAWDARSRSDHPGGQAQ